jgi:predicted DNA-binding antitoxin AbrB/MazE fold protein
MAEIVTAVYERGVLRPLQPLNLREGQRVCIQAVPEMMEEDEGEEMVRLLVTAGLMRPRPRMDTLPPDPVSEAERHALAERLGQAPGKPLSQIVIEDRGEW